MGNRVDGIVAGLVEASGKFRRTHSKQNFNALVAGGLNIPHAMASAIFDFINASCRNCASSLYIAMA